jgi:uncharacterized protein
MLLAFRAENARSFCGPVELSLVATRLAEAEVVREIPWRQGGQPIDVLPVAGLFGANASGKTNLLRIMSDLRGFVVHSFRRGNPGGGMPARPFLLGDDEDGSPTTYEVDVVLGGVLHKYRLKIDGERVLEESAHSFPRGRSLLLFERTGDDVRLGATQRGRGRAVMEILRPNALFLSTAAATNHPLLIGLFEWFQRNLLFADVQSRSVRQALTAGMLEQDDLRERVLELLREADLGITGAKKRELDPEIKERVVRALNVLHGEEEGEEAVEEIEFDDFEVRLLHRSSGGDVELNPVDESRGTLIWFGMVGPVIEALQKGSLLLADELDASLHPTLVGALISLFQSKQSNPRRAQLIFNAHDATVMGDSATHPLGRDQIWFTEKNEDGGTRLYPLSDLDPRKGEAVGRRYLAGRYGATPIISTRALQQIAESVPAGVE